MFHCVLDWLVLLVKWVMDKLHLYPMKGEDASTWTPHVVSSPVVSPPVVPSPSPVVPPYEDKYWDEFDRKEPNRFEFPVSFAPDTSFPDFLAEMIPPMEEEMKVWKHDNEVLVRWCEDCAKRLMRRGVGKQEVVYHNPSIVGMERTDVSVSLIESKNKLQRLNAKIEEQSTWLLTEAQRNTVFQIEWERRWMLKWLQSSKYLEHLKTCVLMEYIPKLGNNLWMMYSTDTNGFVYYADRQVPSAALETVARKYVITFGCRPLYIDVRRQAKEKQGKQGTQGKKEKEADVLRNHFRCLGKLADFPLLQKPVQRHPAIRMSYAEYKAAAALLRKNQEVEE